MSVRHVLEPALEMQRPLAEEKSIALALEYDPAFDREMPLVRADQERVARVFANLIGNALKFTPDGGRVVLRAEGAGAEVRFSVSDNGSGISPEQLPHVFDRFWQARHARRGGAGLGLAIAKAIVEAHRGRLWVESRVGAGSTFSFTLPVAAPRPERAPDPAP
jgi:signal transduction histidine kinase